jgi:hypothetical protein
LRLKLNRQISDREAAVVRAAIEHACVNPIAHELIKTVSELYVVGQCGCGCDTVNFEPDPSEHSRPIADGIGATPSGGTVGVLVFGTSRRITGLEIYDLGAGEFDLRLPEPSSVRPFNKGQSPAVR